MQLSKLIVRRGDSLIRKVSFKSGLNLILDKPTHQKTQSGNNVGKTTVLRLVDYCLGADGNYIWQDTEFKKNINQEVYDFLHGSPPVTVELELKSRSRNYVLTRSFIKKKAAADAYKVDGELCRNITEYRSAVRNILFNAGGGKPTLRQLIPKFVRSSPQTMARTLKFLGDYASDSDYESVHLFLFGFFDVDVLEERPQLQSTKKNLARDLEALTRIRNEGEIEQLLLLLRSEVEQSQNLSQLQSEIPEIAMHADRVAELRAKAMGVAATLANTDAEIQTIQLAIRELRDEYSDVDRRSVERIYKEAERYIPDLQHDWAELVDFIQNLRGRKERFLNSQAHELQEQAATLRHDLRGLQDLERREIGSLHTSSVFLEALETRTELQEKLRRVGGLEQQLADIQQVKSQLDVVTQQIGQTKDQIDDGKAALRQNVAIFNKYFSRLSKDLYGEEYLLHFDETKGGGSCF